MKKLFTMICAIVMMCVFVSCGDGSGGGSKGGASSVDEAARCHFLGLYEKDWSQWEKILPKKFIETHEEVKAKFLEKLGSVNVSEALPGGKDSLYYEKTDYTDSFLEGSDVSNVQNLKDVFAKYGVEDIEEVWEVESNFQTFDNETLIIKSNGKYYSTYAYGICLELYGEETEGCFL